MYMLDVPPENISNFGKTNVNFCMSKTDTLADKGSRTVSIQKARSTQRATAMLGVTMSGEKIKLFVIFKAMRNGRISREFSMEKFGYPTNMHYAVQKNAWMDEEAMLEWVAEVWKPFTDTKKERVY